MAVLHIVLMILKIIGILLLILLGLLLLTVLMVLFCPVRYRAWGYRERGKYGGKAGVSWLFHLISFSLWYESVEGEARYELRIFGLPVLKLLKKIRRKKAEKKRRRKSAKAEKRSIEQQENFRKEAGHKDQKEYQKQEEKKQTEEKQIEEQQKEQRQTGRQKEENAAESKEESGEKTGRMKVLTGRLKGIFQIPEKIIRALKNFRLTAQGICDKIKQIKSFLEDERFKRGMRLILQEGKRLAGHGLPGKIKGRIKFGTEDPCLTGEILGAAGIFYPLYGENFTIEPCFDQTVLEGNISLRGRMYGVMFLVSAVKIFRSRDVRYIIRHFK